MVSKALYFECFAGMSGDMCLAALINMGVPEEYLQRELAKLGLEDEYKLRVSKSQKLGIHGLRVDVDLMHHDHNHTHDHHHHPNQRDFKQIKAIINQSTLSQKIKTRALSIFEVIAQAEATIHNVSVESVHFHEVGATDSIVDILGAAIGLEYLIAKEGISRILSSPIELGSGKVKCAHGVYPIPAPATAQILVGVPVTKGGDVAGEATTPTGAAILKACVDEFVHKMQGVPRKTVYGIGHRDAEIPNVVRLQIIDGIAPSYAPSGFKHVKIEANIDDMSPEAFEPLLARLFEAGASDAFLQPILMKKSRPAQLLSVLCKNENVQKIGEIVLNHSSTIGLRILPFQKMVLEREIVRVPTSAGDVSVKIVVQPDGKKRFKSEHDEIVRLAKESGESYLSLKRRLDSEIDVYMNLRVQETFE